ncbi:MAG TPA: phosphatidylserine/phosphatidylglycerophosphate/cardiolipin synthase family protein [Caulobacteraceae bacterium]
MAGGKVADFELLAGSDAFWRRARGDLARARERLFVQAMTFEGDGTGLAVAEAISASPARDRRILVDGYTRAVINDRLVWSPAGLLDRRLQAERRETNAMFRRLVGQGIRVRTTNPIGLGLWRYPARNHKKLIVADDVAYIGGINFSDHNFAWSDFMVRIEGKAPADFLAGDFAATFAGVPRPSSETFGAIRLLCLDGRSNAKGFAELFGMIAAARREITVVSPYLTFPFTDALAKAAKRGVGVRVITPLANNKPLVRDYLLANAVKNGLQVSPIAQMSHEKGILIDEEHLIVGSSNFDFVSLACEEEILAVVSARPLIEAFVEKIVAPALANAAPPGAKQVSALAGAASGGVLRMANLALQAARSARRTASNWPR